MSHSHRIVSAIALWLLTMPGVSIAAQVAHWDVKGVQLGSTFEELAKEVGNIYCWDITSGSDFEIGIDKKCHEEGFKVYSFAGQETHIVYGLHQGVVWKIELSNIRPDAFDFVVAAMESKYGKAAVVKSDIQNRMGAHFAQATAVWASLDC